MEGYNVEGLTFEEAVKDIESLQRTMNILANSGSLTVETAQLLAKARDEIDEIAVASVAAHLKHYGVEQIVILDTDPRFAGGFSGGHLVKADDVNEVWKFVQVRRRGEIPLVAPEPVIA